MNTAMNDTLLVDIAGNGLARVTLNRADVHNAFNPDMIAALTDAFAGFAENTAVRAVLLTGAGRSFSAGADLGWMKAAAGFSGQENREDALRLSAMLSTINDCPKPVIAVVHGAAFGGGVGLTAVADMTIASRDAKFSLSEVRLGLTPATISPYVLAAIGARAARRYFLTAERFDAEAAFAIGLVHSIAADRDAAIAEAEVMVDEILKNAPGAVADAKGLIADFAGRPIGQEIRTATAERIAARRGTDEAKEGITAFFAKRPPAWSKEQ